VGADAWLRDREMDSDTTDDALRVEEGSLYPALHRLEDKGFVEAKWGVTDTKRQAKFYSLTTRGRLALQREMSTRNWRFTLRCGSRSSGARECPTMKRERL
jgi:DNA-binding PadR family transcriptional regulator